MTTCPIFMVEQCSISEARAKLRKLHIQGLFNLDCYIVEHPVYDQGGRRCLISRLEALADLVGYFSAETILHEMLNCPTF